MKKLKNSFFLSALLVLLFIMLLGTPSTCYAKTKLTEEEANYIWNYFFNYSYENSPSSYYQFNGKDMPSLSKSRFYQEGQKTLLTYFNNNNTLDFDLNNLIIWNRIYGSSRGTLYYSIFNNGKSNLPHLYLNFSKKNDYILYLGIYPIDSQKNVLSDYKLYCIDYNFTSDSITFSNFRIGKMSNEITDSNNQQYEWYDKSSDWNVKNINNGDSIIQSIPRNL